MANFRISANLRLDMLSYRDKSFKKFCLLLAMGTCLNNQRINQRKLNTDPRDS